MAESELIIKADPPRMVSIAALPPPSDNPDKKAEQAQRRVKVADRRKEDEGRWRAITELGGIDKWVQQQLVQAGLYVDTDPSTLTDSTRGAYKEKKKAEAKEKRRLKHLAWRAYKATHINHLGVGIHWTDAVDIDRFDIEKREERGSMLGMPELKGADDLAQALEMSISKLRWMCFHRDVDTGSHYKRFTIPKRDGTPRTITAPKHDLKEAQRWVLRNVVDKLTVHAAAHGFLADRSIVSNALPHAGADVVVKIDIKDFFPTVTVPRIKGLLRKAGLAEGVATLISLLCTEAPRDVVEFRNQTLFVATGPRALPQGAPTSPMFTNALCVRMDKRMSGLAEKFGFAYTRYADDLTFSWRKQAGKDKAPVAQLIHGAKRILQDEGFTLHDKKTAVMRKGSRQIVTGLVVNQRQGAAAQGGVNVRVPRDTQRRLRAAIHNRKQGKPGKEGESIAALRGMAAFIYMTDPARGKKFLDEIDALQS